MLNKYYLIFSDPEQNSDQNQYVIVYAHNSQQAYETFKSQYKDNIPLVHYYYKGKYGARTEIDNYVIFFEPTIAVLELV